MKPPVSCSLCNAANHQRCGCPWNKPFEEWSIHNRQLLQQHLKTTKRP